MDETKRQAMINQALHDGVELWEQFQNMLREAAETHAKNSADPEAMPADIREAFLLGSFQASMATYLSSMRPERQRLCLAAATDLTRKLDAVTLEVAQTLVPGPDGDRS